MSDYKVDHDRDLIRFSIRVKGRVVPAWITIEEMQRLGIRVKPATFEQAFLENRSEIELEAHRRFEDADA